jgi:hypothetical protein
LHFFFDDFYIESRWEKAQQNKTRRWEKMETEKKKGGTEQGKRESTTHYADLRRDSETHAMSKQNCGPPQDVAATRRHEAGFTVEKGRERGKKGRKKGRSYNRKPRLTIDDGVDTDSR